MKSLWQEESIEADTVIVHAEGYYATLGTDEVFYYVAELEKVSQQKFRKWIKKFILKKHRIPDDQYRPADALLHILKIKILIFSRVHVFLKTFVFSLKAISYV